MNNNLDSQSSVFIDKSEFLNFLNRHVDTIDCMYCLQMPLGFGKTTIANSQAPVFISRPRRFGKSTIISTLEELFKHGVKPYDGHDSYFKGLDIEKTWNEEHEFDILPLLKQGDSYRPI